MKKTIKKLISFGLLLIPSIVLASAENESFGEIIVEFIAIEIFLTIFCSVFFLRHLAICLSEDSNKMFWKLFYIRIFAMFIIFIIFGEAAYEIDILLIFVGGFIIPSVAKNVVRSRQSSSNAMINDPKLGIASLLSKSNITSEDTIDKCPNCGFELDGPYIKCPKCNTEFIGNTVVAPKTVVKITDFDPIYNGTDDQSLEAFIKRELSKLGVKEENGLIPSEILKRKTIYNILYSILLFVYICLIFFHFPIYTYIIGLIILLILRKITNKYNLIKYLKKEITSRPDEKMTNIIMNTKNSFVEDTSSKSRMMTKIIAIVIPLIIFVTPKILYEKTDNGYAVRFYAYGITNFTSATIPETYNGKPIVSLRGNTFSNMYLLKNVSLPNTITEIRGQAFLNDFSLKTVNLPNQLEYIGGGAFYNCVSIKEVVFPDTVKYMGGEIFYGASSLEKVVLSKNITEIRGNSFEECGNLKSIEIPDKVERIGGHAFYRNTSLESVVISEKSNLKEIGSSAFRECKKLKTIYLPEDVNVNTRAFKDSPTVKYYYGQFIDETKFDDYDYKKFMDFDIGSYKELSTNSKSTQYGSKLQLLSIEPKYTTKSYIYKYKYTDPSGIQTTFIIDEKNLVFEINDNIIVFVKNSNELTYPKRSYINVYFN